MTGWDWLYRLGPGWPRERGWVTIATFVLAGSMLKMAEVHRELWNVELFKTLLTLVIGTAIVNMILAFHFTANKSDEAKSENTGKLADAMRAVAENTALPTPDSASAAADEVADAAQKKANELQAPPRAEYHSYPSADGI